MNIITAQNGEAKFSPDLGFGDLCRYFYRALREDCEDYAAHNVMDNDIEDIFCIGYFIACYDHG